MNDAMTRWTTRGVVINQDEAVRPPARLDDSAAATLPIAAVTAWHAVARRTHVGAGDSVLVLGTGGVALFAIQICLALGASVIATSSSDDKLEHLRRLGVTTSSTTAASRTLLPLSWT